MIAVCWGGAPNRLRLLAPDAGTTAHENEIDEVLQTAATNALGQREGTIIVMDPQTGRVRAVANPQLAFEESFAPGSTIKPFTALAALRAGLIDKNSRTLCRLRYSYKDFATVCAHPRDLLPLNPSEAIAYSCNYYFGTLGERLNEELLGETLRSFGFGKQTFSNGGHHAAGQLLRGKRDPRNALGEGNYLQATPIQLITAYSALVNGGRLLAPRVAPFSDFQNSAGAELEIATEHRAVILQGLRGAVRYGTAARAGLNSSVLQIFGKTGTSTPAKGFRTQGWFVGFAADEMNEALPSPGNIRLAVLVFLKRAHGADAAQVSRAIFEEFARQQDQIGMPAERKQNNDPGPLGPVEKPQALTAGVEASDLSGGSRDVSGSSPSAGTVRVHLVRENITRELSLEEYVLGVVAAEGSSEDEVEALKALAIAARTYAVKNAGRHARDGYDFCTTTHCQRYLPSGSQALTKGSGSPGANPGARAAAAVRATEGEILRDERGELVDSYFSASCGGMTANMQTLWGTKAPGYLRGVRDESCATMPHHSWTDVISAEQLLQALRSDPRTDPGSNLHELTVTRRDASGRAELILIDGERRRTLSGWDFKIIVGRKLGWNLLKSSRFEVARSGSNFIFRGSGFGHGLGLCQEGAHVMAQHGASFEQILAKYFPGTNVARGVENRLAASSSRGGNDKQPRVFADLLWSAEKTFTDRLTQAVLTTLAATNARVAASGGGTIRRATLSSEHFRVSYPAAARQSDIEDILKTLESTRSDLLHRITSAGLTIGPVSSLEIFFNATTGDFTGRTGQPWWAAAATKGPRIEFQPMEVLRRRGVLQTTLRHELVHILIDELGHGRAQRWLAEGLALYFAGEGPLISRYQPKSRMTVAEMERKLERPTSADEMRTAYAAAFREVSNLIKNDGEVSVWRRVAAS